MTVLDVLRILNVAIWLGGMIYMAPGAWAAASGKNVRRGDPMRLACLATGFLMVGFNLRWLLIPDSEALFIALLTLSAVDGVYIVMLARSYGRGGHVG